MTLEELKIFINSIPEDMIHFRVVNGEAVFTKDDKALVLVNNDVMSIYIDKNNKEIQFLHQTEKDIKNLIVDGI